MNKVCLLIVSLFLVFSGVASASDAESNKVTKPDYIEDRDFQKIMSWSDNKFNDFYKIVVSEDDDIVYVNELLEKAQKLDGESGLANSTVSVDYASFMERKKINEWRNKLAIMDDLAALHSKQKIEHRKSGSVIQEGNTDELKVWLSDWVEDFSELNKSDAERLLDLNQSKAFVVPVATQLFVIAISVAWILACMIKRKTVLVMSRAEGMTFASLSFLILWAAFILEKLEFSVVNRLLLEKGSIIVLFLCLTIGLIIFGFNKSMQNDPNKSTKDDEDESSGKIIARELVFIISMAPLLLSVIFLSAYVLFDYDVFSIKSLHFLKETMNLVVMSLMTSIGIVILNVDFKEDHKI